jgi:hypothetical protein
VTIATVLNDRGKLSPAANAALEAALAPAEAVRIVVRGAFGSAFVATDRRVLIWKKGRLNDFNWENLSEIAFGGRLLIRWLQVRGPDIGLVRPGLLNVGELADTIQLGELVIEPARAALAMLVRHRAAGRPRDVGTVAGGKARRSGASTADEVILDAVGAGGRLLLLADRVRIRHTGFRGLGPESLPAEVELPLEGIASIEWRSPGPLRVGHIGFRMQSTDAGGPGVAGPEREVMFYLHQEPAFREIKAAVERRLASLHAPQRKAAGRRRRRSA